MPHRSQEGPHHRRGRLAGALAKKGRQHAVPVGPGDRVEVRVQDHVAGRGGEQVGVGGAESGAVGHAQVVQHRGAGRLAQQVHVAGHVGGGVMPEQAAAPCGAPRVEPGPGPHPGRVLPCADREGGQAPKELALRRHGREAAHRGAVAEPARVERDDVVPSRDRRGKSPEAVHEGLDLHAGAAEVDEQRSDAASRVGRLVPDHGNPDRRAARVPVTQWHPDGGALEAAVAGAPVQDRNRWPGRCRRRGRGGRGHHHGGEQNGHGHHGGGPRDAASCLARRRAHGGEGSGQPAGCLSGDVNEPSACNHRMWSLACGSPRAECSRG